MKKFVTPFYPAQGSEKFFHPQAIAMTTEDLVKKLEAMKVKFYHDSDNTSDEELLRASERNRTLDEVIEMVGRQ